MLKLTKNNLDKLFLENLEMYIAVAGKYIFEYKVSKMYDPIDLVNEAYVKMTKLKSVDNSGHLRALVFTCMRNIGINGYNHIKSSMGTVELNTEYHQFDKGCINGMTEDEYLKSIFNSDYDFDESISAKEIKDCIEQMTNENQKRILNLLSLNVDTERMRDILGIRKQSTLRARIIEARKSLFTILKEKGLYKDKEYSDIKKFSNRKKSVKLTLEELQLNKDVYMWNDYPLYDSFENKVSFAIKKLNPVNMDKLIGIMTLNEVGNQEIDDTRKRVTIALDKLKEKDLIHIEEKKCIYYNGDID